MNSRVEAIEAAMSDKPLNEPPHPRQLNKNTLDYSSNRLSAAAATVQHNARLRAVASTAVYRAFQL